jgi:hypothetical protein
MIIRIIEGVFILDASCSACRERWLFFSSLSVFMVALLYLILSVLL